MTALLFALAGVFAVLLFITASGTAAIAFCSLGSALLAVVWPLVAKYDLKFGLTGVELSQKVDEANATAQGADRKADAALATLTRFVFNGMPQPTFGNLQKISDGHFGSFGMSDAFREQLRYLRDCGYIQTNNITIQNIPTAGADLSDFVYVTDLGKKFIAERLRAEATESQSLVRNS